MAVQNTGETTYNVVKLAGTDVTINSVAITVLLNDPAGNVLWAQGTAVPTDGSAGYAKGCMFVDTDVAGGTGGSYLNKGTTASSAFTLVTQA